MQETLRGFEEVVLRQINQVKRQLTTRENSVDYIRGIITGFELMGMSEEELDYVQGTIYDNLLSLYYGSVKQIEEADNYFKALKAHVNE